MYSIHIEMVRPRRGLKAKRPGRRALRGRKSVGRRRQPARRQGLPKRQHVQANLGGLSLTRFTATQRPNAVARHIKNTGSPNFINISYPGLIYGEGGVQAFSSWYLNCNNDLQRIWASIQSLFVTPNPTTGVPVAGNGPTTNQSFRYVLESAISMLHLANTSATPLNVELYDVVAKRDSPAVAFDLSGNLITNSGLSRSFKILDPSVAWFFGMNNQNTQATGFLGAPGLVTEKPDPGNLGATPYQSKLFKDYFKVVRKTNLSIPIGGQHKHYVDLKPNRVIDGDMMTQNAIYKGLSFFTLIVVSGVPVTACPGNGSLPGIGGDVSTSAVSLSVIQNVKYKWTWTEDSRENVYRAKFINDSNLNDYSSVQPAMVKVLKAQDWTQSVVNPTAEQFVSLPSECTRVEPPA